MAYAEGLSIYLIKRRAHQAWATFLQRLEFEFGSVLLLTPSLAAVDHSALKCQIKATKTRKPLHTVSESICSFFFLFLCGFLYALVVKGIVTVIHNVICDAFFNKFQQFTLHSDTAVFD